MRARRLEFGYIKTISSADEKSFPLLVRSVSMKELLVIFPSIIIGMVLFLKGEIIYAAIPLMFAFYVLFYNEKSVPFYYQFLSFFQDFLVTGQKGVKKPKEKKTLNIDLKKYKKDLGQILILAATLSVVLYNIDIELYAVKINFAVLFGLTVIAGILTALIAIRVTSLVSKR
jgi:hypothetical protein